MAAADDVTLSSCQSAWDTSLQWYIYSVMGSLMFTIFCVGIYYGLLRSALEGAPHLRAQFYCVTGSLKMALSLLILIVFVPQCPEFCTCINSTYVFYVYPLVSLLVGAAAILQAMRARQHARQVINNDKDAVFDRVPTVEMA